jgi:hypothetical protein
MAGCRRIAQVRVDPEKQRLLTYQEELLARTYDAALAIVVKQELLAGDFVTFDNYDDFEVIVVAQPPRRAQSLFDADAQSLFDADDSDSLSLVSEEEDDSDFDPFEDSDWWVAAVMLGVKTKTAAEVVEEERAARIIQAVERGRTGRLAAWYASAEKVAVSHRRGDSSIVRKSKFAFPGRSWKISFSLGKRSPCHAGGNRCSEFGTAPLVLTSLSHLLEIPVSHGNVCYRV